MINRLKSVKSLGLCLRVLAGLVLLGTSTGAALGSGPCGSSGLADCSTTYGGLGELFIYPSEEQHVIICQGAYQFYLEVCTDDYDHCEIHLGWPWYDWPQDDSKITWSGDLTGTAYDEWDDHVFYSSIVFDAPFTVGRYEITAEADDLPECQDRDDPAKTVKFVVDIKPEIPECSAADYESRIECSTDDSGNSGCGGSCGGDGPARPRTNRSDFEARPAIPGPGMGGSLGGSGGDVCNRERVQAVDTCYGLYAKVWDRCGYCAVVGLEPYIPLFGEDPNPITACSVGYASISGSIERINEDEILVNGFC